MTEATLTPEMTMEQIISTYPASQRALFQRYHIGGCSSCAYQPTDTLAKVCKDHNILDVNEVVTFVLRSQEADDKMQVEPADVSAWQQASEDFSFLDVRQPDEIAIAALPGAEPLDFTDQERYMQLPKDRRIVFACKSGERSLDVAAYFAGHGFTQVLSMRGGLDAWRATIDPTIQNY
jgi:rhodanese-related sulfurtransferase